MCNAAALVGVGAFANVYGTYGQYQAQADTYEAQADSYDYNANTYDEKARIALKEASLSEAQAVDSRVRGKVAEKKLIVQGNMLIGAQRASYGASGVRVDTGAPVEVQQETARSVISDAMTVRKNAAKEAYGYRLEAWRQRNDAMLLKRSATLSRKSAGYSRDAASSARRLAPIAAIGSGASTAANILPFL